MVRNVVLFCLDSVRKDYFDQFARRLRNLDAVSFNKCRSASSWSIPSHASMFSGRLPHKHGVHLYDKSFDKISATAPLVNQLPDSYTSIGISANVFASSYYGFDSLFDKFVEVSTGRRFPHGIDPNEFYLESNYNGLRRYLAFLWIAITHDHPVASLMNGFLAQLNVLSRDASMPKLLDDGANVIQRVVKDSLADSIEPFFMFTNHGDAHTPLRPIREFDETLYSAPPDWSTDDKDIWDVMGKPDNNKQYLRYYRELHGAAIEYLDRKLLQTINLIADSTDLKTTFIITSDHGENLGYDSEDGLVGHKSSLSEGLLHVPFLIVNPPTNEWSKEESRPFSQLKLPELVTNIAAGNAPDLFSEILPAELLGMSPGPDPPTDYDYWNRAVRSAYRDGRKWIWDSQGECLGYELTDEPLSKQVLSTENIPPDWALTPFDNDISTALEQTKRAANDVNIDRVVEARLEELGYI